MKNSQVEYAVKMNSIEAIGADPNHEEVDVYGLQGKFHKDACV